MKLFVGGVSRDIKIISMGSFMDERLGNTHTHTHTHTNTNIYTGLFISPSRISELDCATTKTDTAERSISIGRESLQVFFCTRGLGVLPGSTARG